MPSTALRPASPRQTSFITSLVGERNAADLAPLMPEVAAALRGEPVRRDLIDRLIAVPRGGRVTGSRPTTSLQNIGAPVLTPSDATRAGRMLLGGGIEATVTLADGRHVTVNVRTRARSGRGYRNAAPQDEGARTNVSILGRKIGWINVDAAGNWTLTLRTRRDEYVQALDALFAYAAGQHITSGNAKSGIRVQEASRCGRCMRTLTDPISIDRGIGPECFGRTTGSRHVAPLAQTSQMVDPATVTGEPGAPTEDMAAAFADAALEAAEAIRFARHEDANGEPREQSLTAIAATAEQGRGDVVTAAAKARARDLIAEALDAYCTDLDRDFAMTIFDQLAAR